MHYNFFGIAKELLKNKPYVLYEFETITMKYRSKLFKINKKLNATEHELAGVDKNNRIQAE